MTYFYGYPQAEWGELMSAIQAAGLERPAEAAAWLRDHACALIEERARTMLAESKLYRIRKELDR